MLSGARVKWALALLDWISGPMHKERYNTRQESNSIWRERRNVIWCFLSRFVSDRVGGKTQREPKLNGADRRSLMSKLYPSTTTWNQPKLLAESLTLIWQRQELLLLPWCNTMTVVDSRQETKKRKMNFTRVSPPTYSPVSNEAWNYRSLYGTHPYAQRHSRTKHIVSEHKFIKIIKKKRSLSPSSERHHGMCSGFSCASGNSPTTGSDEADACCRARLSCGSLVRHSATWHCAN